MFERWSFGRRLGVGFGLTTLVFVVIAAVSYRNTSNLIENYSWVTHTQQVQTDLADLLSTLKDAETGQRGYLLTGSDAYLEPYQSALPAIAATFADLTKLTADNPSQERRLATLSPLIQSKLDELKQTIELRRSQGLDAALKVVETNAGKTTMDQIRAVVSVANQAEDNLLKQRAEEAHAGADQTLGIVLWGSLGGVIAAAAIGWFIIRSLSNQIGSAVAQVRSSSTELQAAANQQATGSKEQATALVEITTTITELLATSRQIADSARRVAGAAEETASAAGAGHGTVDSAHESISGIKRQVDQIVSHMLELGKKSQEIGAVLEIVSELAEQTNILAINASIEAAGAGETGKRFGVVADEIRKLADRVGGSAKEIRTLIDDVRGAVNTTVMATETGAKAVDAGSRQFTEVASSFRRISNLVSTTTEASRKIGLSTKQQASAVEQVNVAINSVAQAAKETEASAGQTLQAVSQLAGLSNDLQRIIRPQLAA